MSLTVNADPLAILQHTFGYDQFRGRQQEIINTVIAGNDALVIMPTGGGKSLCYQIPALVRQGVGIVISPLIALMQDQVQALQQAGVSAGFLNSTQSLEQQQDCEQALLAGHISLLYIAPERLTQTRTQHFLQRLPIALFAIDEAHCVSQWGHDFRRDYLNLSMLAEHFPHVPRIALTATADSQTQAEIITRLHLEHAPHFICGFDRANIQYHIEQKTQARAQLINFLKSGQKDNAGIIYCLSRKRVDDIARWLCKEGFDAMPFHAGMSTTQRTLNQDRFLREDGVIMVATVAFGMGIDKPDVRFVVHMDMPKSIESYYQETGRAGRDGDAATALMLYGMEDVIKLKQMASNSEGSDEFVRLEQQRLNALLGLCEITSCRRQVLLRYFGDNLDKSCGNCDNCLEPPQTWNASEECQKALSCAYRAGQRFGANHLIDILRGADNEKIRQFGHQALSTYGIGRELSNNQWRAIFRQLIALGYLHVNSEAYGALQLTEKCRALLKGEEALQLRQLQSDYKRQKTRLVDDIVAKDMKLWQALRACRKDLADKHKVPPFVIFHDTTLKEMLVVRPQTRRDLLTISGIGDAKVEKYGDTFLDIIHNYELGFDDED